MLCFGHEEKVSKGTSRQASEFYFGSKQASKPASKEASEFYFASKIKEKLHTWKES